MLFEIASRNVFRSSTGSCLIVLISSSCVIAIFILIDFWHASDVRNARLSLSLNLLILSEPVPAKSTNLQSYPQVMVNSDPPATSGTSRLHRSRSHRAWIESRRSNLKDYVG